MPPAKKSAVKAINIPEAGPTKVIFLEDETDLVYIGIDPQIVLEVEDVLFAFPRSQLMTSELFQDMLCSQHLGSPNEGSQESPIRLAEISRVSLSQMIAFHKIINWRRFEGELILSVKHWSEALQLATAWGFQTLRHFIVEHLDSLLDDPLRRIKLADQCDIKEWLNPSYAKLCARATPLTAEEGEVLGIKRFAALCRIREEALQRNSNRCASSWGGTVYSVEPGYASRCCKKAFELDSDEQEFLRRICQAPDLSSN
ncbi:hypothetical protein FRB90_006648 [Tulasnella sp. 427]|nr:hypothetical protein FRB90_006648 [Tulasnella sp. 427]